jgi:hypothetical protein
MKTVDLRLPCQRCNASFSASSNPLQLLRR